MVDPFTAASRQYREAQKFANKPMSHSGGVVFEYPRASLRAYAKVAVGFCLGVGGLLAVIILIGAAS